MANKSKSKKKHNSLSQRWKRFGYKHTTATILFIIVFVLALDTAIVRTFIDSIEHLGILGFIIAGAMYTSFFTGAPAIILLIQLGQTSNPFEVALFGGIGSVIGDLIILKIFEDKVAHELVPLMRRLNMSKLLRAMRRKKNRDRAMILGAIAIASPVPDEIGIGLLGIAHLSTAKLILITYVLNAAGILLLVILT